jgi:hypothetical protein
MIKNITTSGLLLAVILFLFACDDPNKLGLDLQRDDQRISTFVTDTFSIETSMRILDTMNTTSNGFASRTQVGSINDAKFGRIQLTSFGSVLLPNSGIKLTDTDNRAGVLDSIRLELLVSYTLGDTSQTVRLNVHRLATPIDPLKNNYYGKDEFPVAELLGSANTKIKTGSTVNIKLSNAFAQEILSKEGSDEGLILDNFTQFFKGLRISMEGANNLSFGFDPTDQNGVTRLVIYYKNVSTEASSKAYPLFFTDRNGAGPIFTNVKADFSQTRDLRNLSPNLSPTSRSNNRCYSMGSVGIMTLLKFPTVQGFGKNKDVIVNRAELIIEPTPDNFTTSIKDQTFPNLRFLIANADGQFAKIEDRFYNYLLFEGSADLRAIQTMNYLSGGRSYQPIIVTSYIQALMNNTLDNNGLFVLTDRFFSSVEGVSFGDNKATQNRMRLLIYYTKIQR